MIEFINNLQEKIDARIMRERALIFLSAIALVFMLWNFVVQAPIEKNLQEVKLKISTSETLSASTQTQITALTQAFLNDPNKTKKAQIAQLQSDIDSVEAKLHSVSQGLIKAEQLPQVLQEALQKTSQLTLLEVSTFPAHELTLMPIANSSISNNSGAEMEAMHAGIYEHVVEVRVAGNYFQVVDFLIALETLPWRFYWQRLDYAVLQYPNAEIILRVYTLSSEEGLLGV